MAADATIRFRSDGSRSNTLMGWSPDVGSTLSPAKASGVRCHSLRFL